MNNNNNILSKIEKIPVVTYNAEKHKDFILKENKNKSGIYRWVNIINNKSYIGSAKCLNNRLGIYYSSTTIKKRLEKGSSAIHSALLKYSYNNFKLEILEYCEQNILISREQYYIDLLMPEYNICKIAGSTLGKVHSEATKEKIRNSIAGKNHPFYDKHHTYETRKKIGKALKLSNRICIMPRMRVETKLKLSLVTIGVDVKVFDLQNNLVKEFSSINKAGKYFDVGKSTINKAIKTGRPYQNLIFKSYIKENRI
jgi:group I intron endonuclease